MSMKRFSHQFSLLIMSLVSLHLFNSALGQNIYYANANSLYKHETTENSLLLTSVTGSITSLWQFNHAILFSDNNGIYSFDLITEINQEILTGINVTCICVDEDGVLYGFNYNDSSIFSCNLNNSQFSKITKTEHYIRDIDVCSSDNVLFLRSYSKLYSLSLNDLSIKPITELAGTTMAFDPNSRHLYFDLTILYMDGSSTEGIASYAIDLDPFWIKPNFILNINDVNDIFVTKNKLYWLDFRTLYDPGRIVSSNLDGSGIDTVVYRSYADKILIEQAVASNIDTKGNESNWYPNPTNGMLYFTGFPETNHTVRIYTSMGNLVDIIESKNNHIDVSHLPAGLYIFQISSNNMRIQRRIVKSSK